MAITSQIIDKDRYIQCWGDSLTESTSGGITYSNRWPVLLSSYFEIPILNGGVGGESANQIATRQLIYQRVNTAINIIWAGRNGVLTLPANDIKNDIQSMVNHVGDSRYIVMSVINKTDGTENVASANYNLITTLNTLLQSTFPSNYLDVMTNLNDNALRVDGLHLNNDGNLVVNNALKNFITSKNWV